MKKIISKEIFSLLIVVIIVTVLIRLFVFDVFVVKGDSMAPSILNGEIVFVNKTAYYFDTPKRGDVIVVIPRNMNSKIIKRVIGMPRERIEILENRVVIRNEKGGEEVPFSEGYLEFKETLPMGKETFTLDPNEYFVMGDNRYISVDSRVLGPVDDWEMKGKVIFAFNFRNLMFKPFYE